MSISGSNSGTLRPYTARELIEGATRRAGISADKLTSEIVESSLDELNLVFTQFMNRGIQLWKRQRMILPLYLNVATVPLPPGVNVVDKLTRRGLTRQTGTPFTSAGGDAEYAFDGDLSTTCSQTSDDGYMGCTFDQATQITSVGVLFATAMTEFSIFFEYSIDGSTAWTSLDAWTGTVAAGEWVWVDLDGAPDAIGWRIRVVSDVPMEVTELFFGNNPSEIPLDPWNLDEYNSMPNKTSPGRVLNYYQQRNLDNPLLYVWPVPDNQAVYDTLTVWVKEYLDTVSEPTQSLDVPRRWYDAVTASLARRLCRSLPEADMKRYDLLRAEEEEAMQLAEGEERDFSNSNIDMGIGAYTA